jgi:hypothetical protein
MTAWQRRDAEPFEEGNDAARKHGARSPRLLSPIADDLKAELARVAPWTAMEQFRLDVEAWAWAEASCRLYREWFDVNGVIDDEGQVPAAHAMWQRSEATAREARVRLGVSPSAWAKLLSTLGSSDGEAAVRAIESLKKVGRELGAATKGGPGE